MLRTTDFKRLSYLVLKSLKRVFPELQLKSSTAYEFYCCMKFAVPSDFHDHQGVEIKLTKWTNGFMGYPDRDLVSVYYKVWFDDFHKESVGHSKQFDYKDVESIEKHLHGEMSKAFEHLPPTLEHLDKRKLHLDVIVRRLMDEGLNIHYIKQLRMGQYDEILLVQFVGRYDSEHFSISVHYANKDKILLVLCGKIKKAMELDADATVLSVYELNATMSILRPVL